MVHKKNATYQYSNSIDPNDGQYLWMESVIMETWIKLKMEENIGKLKPYKAIVSIMQYPPPLQAFRLFWIKVLQAVAL